ncbi:MAG: hypothetical protein NVS2B11_07010 [Acetobacteraceae bacterium]
MIVVGTAAVGRVTLTGNGSVAGMALFGRVMVSGRLDAPNLVVGGAVAADVVVGAGGVLAAGGAQVGTGAGAVLGAEGGGQVEAGSIELAAGGTLRVDGQSLVQVGSGAASGSGIRVLAGTTLTAHGGRLEGDVAMGGTLRNDGSLVVAGNMAGSGTLALGGGMVDVAGVIGGETVAFGAAGVVLRVHGLYGATAVSAMQFGDAIDLAGVTGASLSADGGTVTAGSGTLQLAAAPSGYAYKLYGDAAGGTEVLLDPTTPPSAAISSTDVVTGASQDASGDGYAGPVDYLQRQFIYGGTDGVAIRANVPNTFLKGGPGGDALAAGGGNNVLDGDGGSNFPIGGSGADGGHDTFFVDARGGVVTWSTIVNFHAGDQATMFGFHPGTSTRPLTGSDGTAGYTGATIHSEIAGSGTGVTASFTFAGIDTVTVLQHFTFSEGTLPGGIDYLLVQYL